MADHLTRYISNAGGFGHVADIPETARIHAPLAPGCKASVIIPVYNERQNVIRCLKQLAGQKNISPSSYEVIIVDNGSTDGTDGLVREWLQQRKPANFHLVYEPGRGVACARKRGFDEAVLRYTESKRDDDYFLLTGDADNTFGKEWIAGMASSFLAGKADMLAGGVSYDKKNLLKKPNLLKFIKLKETLENRVKSIYGGRAEGNNYGMTLSCYAAVGGIKLYRYIHNDTYYYRASDDWIVSAQVLEHNLKLEYVPEIRVRLNPRKYIYSLERIIAGNLYLGDWEGTDNTAMTDINRTVFHEVAGRQIRGLIAYHILLNIYLQPSLLKKDESITFLGIGLTRNLADSIHEIKQIYPGQLFNPFSTYYLPAWHLFFLHGAEIFHRLSTGRADLRRYRMGIPDLLMSELHKQKSPWKKNQAIFTYCSYKASMLAQYFGGWV